MTPRQVEKPKNPQGQTAESTVNMSTKMLTPGTETKFLFPPSYKTLKA